MDQVFVYLSPTVVIFLIGLVLLLLIFTPRIVRLKKISHWRSSLQLNQHEAIYQKMYEEVNGFALSKQARSQNDAFEYVYGEIDFSSFIAVLSLLKPNENSVFYDLGSGTGKAVLACAMVFKVKKSCGVELFPLLHNTALKQKKYLSCIPQYDCCIPTLYFNLGNYLDADFNDATIIFINTTACIGDTWIKLNKKLEQTTPNTKVITTSKPLISSNFQVVQITRMAMSWGIVQAFVHFPSV